MDVHDAAYRVAHDFLPDGAVGLARKLGKVPGTFLNQLNPHQETAKLGLGDAVAKQAAVDPRSLAVRDNLPEGSAVSLDGVPWPVAFAALFRDELTAAGMVFNSGERKGGGQELG